MTVIFFLLGEERKKERGRVPPFRKPLGEKKVLARSRISLIHLSKLVKEGRRKEKGMDGRLVHDLLGEEKGREFLCPHSLTALNISY